MSTLVIVAHPNKEKKSINQTWKETLENRFELVTVHDLYNTYPDSDIDVKKEQDLLNQHEHIVFQFPLYWMSYPPLLQKWLDQVFTNNYVLEGESALKGKVFGLAVSCGQPKEIFSKNGPVGYTLEEVNTHLKAVIHIVGGKFFGIHAIYDTDNIDNFAQVAENADEYITFVEKLEKE